MLFDATRLEDLETVVPPKLESPSMEDLDVAVEDLKSVQNEISLSTLRLSSQNLHATFAMDSMFRPRSLPALSSLLFCFLCLSSPRLLSLRFRLTNPVSPHSNLRIGLKLVPWNIRLNQR